VNGVNWNLSVGFSAGLLPEKVISRKIGVSKVEFDLGKKMLAQV